MTFACVCLLTWSVTGPAEKPRPPSLPPLAELEQRAVRRLALGSWNYPEERERLRARHWLPTITMRGNLSTGTRSSLQADASVAADYWRSGGSAEVELTWSLSGLLYDDHEVSLTREHVRITRFLREVLGHVRADYFAYGALADDIAAGECDLNAETRSKMNALRASLADATGVAFDRIEPVRPR